MRPEPNPLVRIIVPVVLLLAGVGIAWAMLRNTQSSTSPAPAQPAQTTPSTTTPAAATADKPATPTAGTQPTPGAQSSPGTEPAASTPTMQAAPTGVTYTARAVPRTTYAVLGELPPASTPASPERLRMRLTFSPLGAGLAELALADHFTSIQKTEHEVIQRFAPLPTNTSIGLVAFSADAIELNGVTVPLWFSTGDTTFWRETAPGAFEAVIADDKNVDVCKITRRYILRPGSYEFLIEQRIINLTQAPLKARLICYGPIDQPLPQVRYGGDTRRVEFGYRRPGDPTVVNDDYVIAHQKVLGNADGTSPTGVPTWKLKSIWPNPSSIKNKHELAFAATTGRYFTVAVHAPVSPATNTSISAAPPSTGGFGPGASIDRAAVFPDPATHSPPSSGGPAGVLALRISGPELTIDPAATADASVNVYAGPISKKFIANEPIAQAAGLESVIIYTFGGPCAFCTFQSIAQLLRWLLGVLHDYVVFDWAIAVMLLVVCVRTLLHPITRMSQTSLLRFSKQMQRVAPKQKALQEKYKNDPVKMREELARLMREENVNYLGALGCLPTLLQTPVWIALYATIYFTFELRHEHAFFGVFQHLTNHHWDFLGDLAEPDHLINLKRIFGWSSGLYIPLLSTLMGPIESINLIPLILGVVFYIQQKYMQPPTTATLTPEQETQQKMIKVMTVVMFPLFMYNAPAALSLYFATNSTLGIIESKWIRAKVEREDAEKAAREAVTGGPRRSTEPAKPGFFARLQQAVEAKQRELEKSQRASAKKNPKKK